MESVFIRSSDLSAVAGLEHDKVVLVLPYIDRELTCKAELVLKRRAMSDGLLVLVEDDVRLGFIRVANMVFARTSSQYFGYLAQDVFPGEGWLRCALDVLDKSGGNLIALNDGRFFGNIAVFGIARRDWVRGLYRNCLFYPGYKSHFGDTELSVLALNVGKLVFSPKCMMMEADYEKHLKGNNRDDDSLYRERARSGFGGMTEPFEPV
ncbi:MAG TPA: hypothetical protein DGF30_06785 [Desulfomicrobium sp.]|nr:hypothetical protein [Desulfomicrobium sp.]